MNDDLPDLPDIPDPWRHWQDNLTGRRVPLHEGTPHAGFYRMLGRREYGATQKTFTPVAYWPSEDGELNCRVGDRDVSVERGQELWISVCRYPVTEEAYRAVAERNELWPDEHELVPMQGHNLPPDDNSYEGIRDLIQAKADEAKKRIAGPPIVDQNEYTKLESLANALNDLAKKAEEHRKTERKPHDEGLKAVQAKWSPLVDLAEIYKNIKYKLLTPWDIKQKEAQKEAAEAAAAMGEPPPDIPKRKAVHGKTMSLRTFKSAKITDFNQCLNYFKDSPDIKATVQDLANRAVRAGITVPGAELIEEQKTV